jgi:hypothetical protein
MNLESDLKKELNFIDSNFHEHLRYGIRDAFPVWFLQARFGLSYTEGVDTLGNYSKDKWIDSIYISQTYETVYIIQSKFSLSFGEDLLPEDSIERFADVSLYFTKDGRVNPRIYNEANQKTKILIDAALEKLRAGYKLNLILITTDRIKYQHVETACSLKGISPSKYEVLDFATILKEYGNFLEKKIPKVNLDLHFAKHSEIFGKNILNHSKAMVGTVTAEEIFDQVKKHGNDLFHSNVRSYRKSTVNKGIEETLKNHAKRFWLVNNGIIIICEKMESIKPDSVRLIGANVINGQQTARTIHKIIKRGEFPKAKKAEVLVKVIELKPDIKNVSELSLSIISGSNRQTPVNERDLKSLDPFQVKLQRLLERRRLFPRHVKKYFYERKRNEWENTVDTKVEARLWKYINNYDLARAYAAANINPYTYQVGENALFTDFFDDIFESVKDMNEKDILSAYLFPWHIFKLVSWSYNARDTFHKYTAGKFKGASKFYVVATICNRITGKKDRDLIVKVLEAEDEKTSKAFWELIDIVYEFVYKYQQKLEKADADNTPNAVFKSEKTYRPLKRFLSKGLNKVQINMLANNVKKLTRKRYSELKKEHDAAIQAE